MTPTPATLVLLIVVRFLFGAGEAGAIPNGARILMNWFSHRERGSMQGWFQASMHVGGAIAHAFGVDEDGEAFGPRELGDIVICPEHTVDLREAIVHGALHLTGMDHETDDGEMLALQAEILGW